MKRLIASILLLLAAVGAHGAANDLTLQQRNATDTAFVTRFLGNTVPDNSLLYFDGTTVLPGLLRLGTGLSISSGMLNVTGGGTPGPANVLTIGTVTQGSAAATITGTSPAQVLNLTLPKGDTGAAGADGATGAQGPKGDPGATGPAGTNGTNGSNGATGATGPAGPANSLSIGTVTTGTAAATITGTAPSQTLNLVLPTATPSYSQSSASRSLNTAFQVSATQNALVTYSVQITVTASIAGGQNGDVVLEIASNSGFTTNVQTLAISGVGQTYTLAVALQGVQPQTSPVSGFVPAGYYVRLRTVNNTGTPGFSYRAGQEILL